MTQKNQEFNPDSKIGFAAGAVLAIPFGKYIGFNIENAENCIYVNNVIFPINYVILTGLNLLIL